jgi:hypothetical protein
MINDPMVQLLIKTFDLEVPTKLVIQISRYAFEDGCIKIKEAKVLDSDMNFIRFADLSKLTKHLDKHYCIFNDRATDTGKDNKEAGG